jgi:hypothetical protein
MASQSKPTEGRTIQYAIGSLADKTTTQAYRHMRVNENPEIIPDQVMVAENPNVGKRHFADVSDKPVTYERFREDAFSVNVKMRSNATAGEIDFVEAAMVSAGAVATNRDTETALTSYDGANGEIETSESITRGQGVVVYNNSTNFAWPVLPFYKPSAATYLTTEQQWTADYLGKSVSISPLQDAVGSSNLVSFRVGTRLSATSDEQHYDVQHCGLSSIDGISIKPGEPLDLSFSFHAGDIAETDSALSVETFGDSEKFPVIGDNNLEVILTAAPSGAYSTPLTNDSTTRLNIMEANVTLGQGSIPIEGSGNDSVNDLQGYMGIYEPATITLKALFDKDHFDDFNDGTFAEKYLHFVQATNDYTVRPCWGLFFPRVYQNESPTILAEADSVYMVEIKLVATASNLLGSTQQDNANLAHKPWYMVYSQI